MASYTKAIVPLSHRYCKRIYQPNGETKNVFLTLLRIYLRPTIKTTTDLLTPALDLIIILPA